LLIPIGHEDQRVTRLPWVTIGLVTVNVAIFLFTLPLVNHQAAETRLRVREAVQFASEHPYLRLPEEFADAGPAMRPPPGLSAEILSEEQARLDRLVKDFRSALGISVFHTYGYIPAEPHLLALFTSMFIHGGWLHLIGNMLFLWLAGGSLEDKWGRVVFPALYLVSGVAGALTHAAVHSQSTVPMVGASGAIAGLMGAFLIRLAATRIRFLYWFYFFRGTFYAPAYVALPLWLLQQFAMARSGQAGGVAVWAHIGGFGVGLVAALLIRLTDLEGKVLTPAIEKKTTWAASDRLAAALTKLDSGDLDGALKELEALLRATPDSIEARAALMEAYARKEDHAAAGRESARLVGAYLKARDTAGAMTAAMEHWQIYPTVPLAMRDQVALAAHREKREEYRDAAHLLEGAIAAWPDDPLAPKALLGLGRLQLQVFDQPGEALVHLERAQAHPHATPEFQQASAEMIARARVAPQPEPPRLEAAAQAWAAMSQDQTPPEPPIQDEAVAAPTSQPVRALLPVALRAVGIDAQALQLQDGRGGTGRLPWRQVSGVSVAKIGPAEASDQAADSLILDLVVAQKATSGGVRCIRLSMQDLAIPQLQGEPSPLRAFQRLVATILKVSGATAHPNREACLGLHGFPAFPDLATYEADLAARLATPTPAP